MKDRTSTAETLEWALDTLRRYAPDPFADAQEYEAEQQRRELARFNALPRGPSQPNPLDRCHDCGGEAEHYDYRNGRAIGLCDECHG
jgi:hypothetical protein